MTERDIFLNSVRNKFSNDERHVLTKNKNSDKIYSGFNNWKLINPVDSLGVIAHESSIKKLDVEKEVRDYISKYLIDKSLKKILIADNGQILKAFTDNGNQKAHSIKEVVIDLEITNRKKYINKYLLDVNKLLPNGGLYIGRVETNKQRNGRVYRHWNKYIAKIFIFFEFIFHRIFPKLKLFRKSYFSITKRKYRFLSLTEALGRLVFCGFKIQEFREINGLTYFIAIKQRVPEIKRAPLYGPIFKMNRLGKEGKMFKIYKIRTMHSYAEYLQDFVVTHNGYSEVGKPSNDFRVASWGRFFRKYWLDELPQLFNVLRGEMKLVSIRPVSLRFLEEYPEEIKRRRMKFKPGCIPPYVALLKQDVKEYIEAERIYMDEIEKHPYITDLKYFAKAVYNILTRKIRSE